MGTPCVIMRVDSVYAGLRGSVTHYLCRLMPPKARIPMFCLVLLLLRIAQRPQWERFFLKFGEGSPRFVGNDGFRQR